MKITKRHRLLSVRSKFWNVLPGFLFNRIRNQKSKRFYPTSTAPRQRINRRRLYSSILALTVLLVLTPIIINIKTFAAPSYNTKSQTNWNGGLGTSVVNQYAEVNNLDASAENKIVFVGPSAGSLVSNVFDLGDRAFFGKVSFSTSGTGTAKIQVRTTSGGAVDPSTGWSECSFLDSGTNISSAGPNCFKYGEHHLQYKITLTNGGPGEFSVVNVTFQYAIDNTPPNSALPTLAQLSSKVRNTPADTYTWNNQLGWGWTDYESGIAGMKYCVVDALNNDGNPWDDCSASEHPENYVGPAGNTDVGTPEYIADTYPIDKGRLTINADDPRYAAYIGEGMNIGMFIVFITSVDNVGNIETPDTFYISKFTNLPSGPPQEIISTNTVPGTNMFSFSWTAPTYVDNPVYKLYASWLEPDDPQLAETGDMIAVFEGSSDEMLYCYTINTSPNPEDENYDADWTENCTRTNKAITSLPSDNYGLRQGLNTIYMVSINEPGNLSPFFMYPITDDNDEPVLDGNGEPTYMKLSNYSQADFNVATFAPDVVRNVEVVDISNRTTEVWRVVLSWIAPLSNVPAVEKYQIFRSVDETNWASIGYTDSLSYVDTDPVLNNLTKYYYQIKACDNADSCSAGADAINITTKDKSHGITPDGRYTTPADLTGTPKASNIGTRRATIQWQTNRESDSMVFASANPHIVISGVFTAGDTTDKSNHEINLTNLLPDTKYYYKVTWTDIDNNTGESSELSFTTLPAPSFSEVNFEEVSISSASVSFTVQNANNVNIYYGKTEAFGGAKTVNTANTKSTYSVRLSDLDDGSKYFVKLNGFDADGNEYEGNVYSFTTLARPRISNLKFQPVEGASSNTTKVSWTTNVPTNSMLSYGVVGGRLIEAIDSKLTLDHEMIISNLEDDKNYSLIARSTDGSGNVAVSDTQTFKTALDTRPPKINDIIVDTSIKGTGAEARGQVVVSWTTDEPATSQIAYGQGAAGSYNNKTSEDSRLSTEHVVIISDLSTSSIFQIQPLSKDKASNETKGTNQSAIVGRGSEDVFTIIFSALRNIFGIKG